MPDIDDLFSEPNAGAYEVEESRTGPPLDYVAEKLRNALESSHRIARGAGSMGSEPGGGSVLDAWSEGLEDLKREADVGFRYSLAAFLALYNMLGLMSDNRKADALLDLDREDFEHWLDRIQQEGSVRG